MPAASPASCVVDPSYGGVLLVARGVTIRQRGRPEVMDTAWSFRVLALRSRPAAGREPPPAAPQAGRGPACAGRAIRLRPIRTVLETRTGVPTEEGNDAEPAGPHLTCGACRRPPGPPARLRPGRSPLPGSSPRRHRRSPRRTRWRYREPTSSRAPTARRCGLPRPASRACASTRPADRATRRRSGSLAGGRGGRADEATGSISVRRVRRPRGRTCAASTTRRADNTVHAPTDISARHRRDNP